MARIPIIALTSGMVILALVGTALVMGLLSDHFSRQGIASLANRYITELSKNVGNTATDYLNRAANTLDLYSNQMAYDMESYHDFEFHRRILYNFMKILPPYYEAVYFADDADNFWYHTGPTYYPTGYTYDVRFFPNSSSNPIPSCNASEPNWIIENYPLDEDGFVGNWTCGWSKYRPTQRPWYKLIYGDPNMNNNPLRKAWSDVYLFAGTFPGLGYTISRAVWRNQSGVRRFVGVSAVDSKAPYLTAFLATLQTTSNTLLYIMEAGGYMVATSKSNLGLAKTLDNGDQVPFMASEWAESRVRELYRKQGATETHGVMQIELDGENHFVSVAQVDAPGQERMTWRIIVAVPEGDFMGEVVEGRFIATMSMIGLCLGVLIICLGISYLIYRPIAMLKDEMASVAVMDLESVDYTRPPSAIKEVGSMQQSFIKMVENLREFRNYMPASILLAGDDEEDEKIVNHDIRSQITQSTNSTARKETKKPTGTGSQSSKRSGAESMAAKKTAVSTMEIKTKRVTVMVVNISKWHSLQDSMVPGDAAALHSQYIKTVMETVNAQKGTPDVFLGDRFLATWNTIRPLGTHRSAACSTIIKSMKALKDVSGKLVLTGGASSSEVRCGNMGTDGMKKFTFMGPCASMAHILERMNKKFQTRVLIDGAVEDEAKNNFVLRPMDRVLIPRILGSKVIRVFEVMAEKAHGEDEWMYQLEDGDSKNPFQKFEAAIDLYFRGFPSQAAEAMNKCSVDDAQKSFWLNRIGSMTTPEGTPVVVEELMLL
eukprot:PhF_6_TR11543/c0_g1_i3/m.18540/K01768/E4.6.1.1; adenylate cyclase